MPPKRVEVGLVVRAGDEVLAEQHIVAGPVVLGRQPEVGGIRRGGRELRGDRSLQRGERDELRHRRTDAVTLVDLADVLRRGQGLLAVRDDRRRRRLVRHQRTDLLRVPGHQGKRVDRPAAAREEVHGLRAHRGDHPVQVVRVLLGCGLGGRVGPPAARDPPRVVGHGLGRGNTRPAS